MERALRHLISITAIFLHTIVLHSCWQESFVACRVRQTSSSRLQTARHSPSKSSTFMHTIRSHIYAIFLVFSDNLHYPTWTTHNMTARCITCKNRSHQISTDAIGLSLETDKKEKRKIRGRQV
ncbi:hypothetical protein GGI43DRAFT_24929 [Trichoderma evansii]